MSKLSLFYKGRMIRTYKLTDQTLLVGRAPVCDIQIDNLSTSEQHARVKPDEGGFLIEQVNQGASILVNHMPVSSTQLQHGDIIQIGKHTMFFSETARDAVSTVAELTPRNRRQHRNEQPSAVDHIINSIDRLPSGCIQVLSGPHIGKMIPLQRSLTRLGLTGNKCAVIAHRDNGYFISHLEGETTPLVDDQAIGDRTIQLWDGCTIQIGNIKVRFHHQIKQSAVS